MGVTPSVAVKNLARREETTIRLGGKGDNWHMTWAADDKQYVSQCDGQGWPGMPLKPYNSRMYAISGSPPDVTFEYLPGYPEILLNFAAAPDPSPTYYNFGTVAVDGRIYQYLSTFNLPASESTAAPAGEFRFIGAKLIYSDDFGATWHNQDGSTPVVWESFARRTKDTMVFYEESQDAFSLLTCLQMGQDYRLNTDGYVYIYAPNGNTEGTMNELVMCRVRKESVLDRSAYEFFAGARGNDATWVPGIDDRGVVHTFPSGWVNTLAHPYAWHPSVVYNAPLGLYMMANWGMGTAPDGNWFGKPSYLGFWTAPNPWGPWTQIHEETVWTPDNDPKARAYQPQISPKWISEDGRSFWLVWTDFQSTSAKSEAQTMELLKDRPFDEVFDGVMQSMPYYAFNVQRVDIDV